MLSVVECYCQGEIPLSHIYGVGLRLEVAIDLSAHKIAIDELHRNARGCEKISRVFSQKPLDKPHTMWYNKDVKGRDPVEPLQGGYPVG